MQWEANSHGKLRSDFEHLIGILRDTLQRLGEEEVLSILPNVSSDTSTRKLSLQTLPEKSAELMSLSFQLLNMAEENSAAQYRRWVETNQGYDKLPGLWGWGLEKMKGYGLTAKEIAGILPTIHIEPVLTAHPTEAKRQTVLELHRELYLQLVQLENQMWTPDEREGIRSEIESIIERLWRTGEIYLQKPDVYSEIRNIEHYLKNVFPEVISILDRRMILSWKKAGFDPTMLREPESFPKISFGDWVGGDRDGHPFVTPEVTNFVLRQFRNISLELYSEKCTELSRKLSLSDYLQNPPKALLDKIEEYKNTLGTVGSECIHRNPDEPWRQFSNLIKARLPKPDASGFHSNFSYKKSSEFAEDLRLLRKSLNSVHATKISEQIVFPLERLVQCFGFHMASLDIRQNSAFHEKAIQQILESMGEENPNYSEWSEEDRLAWIRKEFQTPRPFLFPKSSLGPEASSVLGSYSEVSKYVQEFGFSGIGSFIVSMTRSLSDLLLVCLFLREVGLFEKVDGKICIPFPVVPLFETIDDLEDAPNIIRDFLREPIIRDSILYQQKLYQWNQPTLQIMLGYSDSNKDGGIFASSWNLYSAQMKLTRVAKESNTAIRFFHGRGGTISRGGGKTHRFLDALPHASLTGSVRMTVQGETIAQKFANKMNAAYNLELMLATATKVTARHKKMPRKTHPVESLVEKIAQRSGQIYTELLHKPGFIDFYSQATPIDVIENSRIGSRPARRTGQRSLADLRAIPWVFSWNQARFYLPNWYGAGSALLELKKQNPEDYLAFKSEIEEWHFLKYTILNIESGVYSAHREMMIAYSELVEDTKIRVPFLDSILSEFDRTKTIIDDLFDGKKISDRRPKMYQTIEMRSEYLETLHYHQIDLLKSWRKSVKLGSSDREAEKLLQQLLLSVNAIAGGLRTTG
jgi:phosphoenolpyruvate carboxylase